MAHVVTVVLRADVSHDEECVASLDVARRNMGAPLQGVFHLAGVLRDGNLKAMEWTQFKDVLRPKVGVLGVLHAALGHVPHLQRVL